MVGGNDEVFHADTDEYCLVRGGEVEQTRVGLRLAEVVLFQDCEYGREVYMSGKWCPIEVLGEFPCLAGVFEASIEARLLSYVYYFFSIVGEFFV